MATLPLASMATLPLARRPFDEHGNAASGEPFHDAYPDAVLNDGKTALTPAAFVAAKAAANIRTDEEYVRHILEKHNGEVRHWGAREWTPVPEAFVPPPRRREVLALPVREAKRGARLVVQVLPPD